MPEYLDDRPSGGLSFKYIKLPDYVTDTEPVTFYAYSDESLNNAIFAEDGDGRGAVLQQSLMVPGVLTLDEFSPSNAYAFMGDV
jgi:hypothetical protein